MTLSVDKTHDAVHPVDLTGFTRMVPTVLGTW